MKFEKKLEELDNIIDELKDPNIELEKAIILYRKGIALNEECNKELEEMKLLINTSEGDPVEL